VDTPGHQDFGGEVERIMDMVDGVCLVVCATEGPMTQTKFVLRKALEQQCKPLVVINKVDRPTARVSEVVNEVFEMFCDLNCPDSFLEYPLYYASGRAGWAVEHLNQEKVNIECILRGIVEHVPSPKISSEPAFSMLVTQTQPNTFHGKLVLGKVNSGELSIGKDIKVYNQEHKLIDYGKVTKIIKKSGLSEIDLERAYAGDLVMVGGVSKAMVTHTLIEEGYPSKSIACLKIDEPLMGVSISVNTSPLAGKSGSKVALNDLKQRLEEEAENDVALTVVSEGKSAIQVRGRGDLYFWGYAGTSAFCWRS
jgi:GTP-binding protein